MGGYWFHLSRGIPIAALNRDEMLSRLFDFVGTIEADGRNATRGMLATIVRLGLRCDGLLAARLFLLARCNRSNQPPHRGP